MQRAMCLVLSIAGTAALFHGCVGSERSGAACERLADDPLDGGFFPSPDCIDVERVKPPVAGAGGREPCAACSSCDETPAATGDGGSGQAGAHAGSGGVVHGGAGSGGRPPAGGSGGEAATPADASVEDSHAGIPGVDPPSSPGDVVVTEAMGDPTVASDADGEWIELYNPDPERSLNLYGCEIGDDDGPECTVDMDLLLEPDAYLAIAAGDAPGFAPAYVCGSLSLRNSSADQAILRCGGVEIDRVSFTKAAAGKSTSLDPLSLDAVANDDPAAWCPGVESYNGADLGTPGAANPPCQQ